MQEFLHKRVAGVGAALQRVDSTAHREHTAPLVNFQWRFAAN